MTIKETAQKIFSAAEKYKFALLILLLGLGLLLWPSGSKSEPAAAESSPAPWETESLEARLRDALCKISGVGGVEVVLTVKQGATRILAADETETESKTITVQTGSGTDAVTVAEVYPVYRGALIICDGGDEPTVRLSIINAVSALTGLGSDKITVVKMKSS